MYKSAAWMFLSALSGSVKTGESITYRYTICQMLRRHTAVLHCERLVGCRLMAIEKESCNEFDKGKKAW